MKVFVVGGVALSLVNFRGPLLRAMTELGHEVIACASGSSDEIRRRLSEFGVRYYEIPLQRTGMNPFFDMRTILSLRNLLRVHRPDCALFYTIKPVVYGSFASRWSGVPRTFSMITGLGYAFGEATPRQRALGKAVRQLYRLALKTNEAVFFQNPDDKQLFVGNRLIYERFLEVAPGELKDDYFAQANRTDPAFPFGFTRVVDKRSRIIDSKSVGYRVGFCIDVFPVDNAHDNVLIHKLKLFFVKVIQLLTKDKVGVNISDYPALLSRLAISVGIGLGRFFSARFLMRWQERMATACNAVTTKAELVG